MILTVSQLMALENCNDQIELRNRNETFISSL